MDPARGTSKQRFETFVKQRSTEAAQTKADRGKPKNKAVDKGGAPNGQTTTADWTAEPAPNQRRRAARSVRVLLIEYGKLLRGHHGKLAVSLVLLSIVTLLGLAMPLSTKVVFDYILLPTPGPEGIPAWMGLPKDPYALLWIVGAFMVALAAFNAVIGTLGRYQMTRLGQLVRVLVRRRLFDHMARLPLHRLSAIKSGGVSSILREDAGLVGEMLFTVIYNPLRAVITLIGGLVALTWIDWRMLVGGMLLIPAVYFTHRTWIGRIRPVHRVMKINRQNADAHATEAFSGIRIVRAFDRTIGEEQRFVRNTHLLARQDMLVWRWSRAIEMTWVVLIPLASAAVLVYGGNQVLGGRLTIGDVAAFSTYLLMLLGPLEVLVSTAASLQNGLAGWDRCLDVLNEPIELGGPAYEAKAKAEREASAALLAGTPIEHGLRVAKSSSPGRIVFNGVSFAYPGHTDAVLKQVSFEAAPGQTIALVGPSGSGKTTLCNLVARFFDPTEGEIELDGVNLKDIEVTSFRRLLGIVEQEVFLFDGSVAENIAYARRDATMDMIRAAARSANADHFISDLEKQYNTVIGERGVRLSGGQKQRIAIARALLADPRLLILDEATSNLDSESERLIQSSLATLMKGRTSFVIAHRLSTIRHADRILVLERGRIIETGTHDELVAAQGRYYDMLQIQLHGARDFAVDKAAGLPAAVTRSPGVPGG